MISASKSVFKAKFETVSFLKPMEEIKAKGPTFPQKMNKGQRQPLSPLAIYSKCAEDVLNTPTRPKTRTVGQEEATTPQTIARSTSTPE